VQAALKKFELCQIGLTVPELYREPRYSRVQQLAADVRRTSNDDAADALLSLFTAPDASALTAV